VRISKTDNYIILHKEEAIVDSSYGSALLDDKLSLVYTPKRDWIELILIVG